MGVNCTLQQVTRHFWFTEVQLAAHESCTRCKNSAVQFQVCLDQWFIQSEQNVLIFFFSISMTVPFPFHFWLPSRMFMHAVSITTIRVEGSCITTNQPINPWLSHTFHSIPFLNLNIFIKAGYLQEQTWDLVYILHLYDVYYRTLHLKSNVKDITLDLGLWLQES